MLVIQVPLKSTESLQNGLQPHSGVALIVFNKTNTLASSQHLLCVDADVFCKRDLYEKNYR